ncbi:MAG: histidine kinase [Lachnospiraceae bacterium]|nr:histidine kinase [Lachnospiraceae bacterium]
MNNQGEREFNKWFFRLYGFLVAAAVVICIVVGMHPGSQRYDSWESVPGSFIRKYTYLEYEDETGPAGIRREYVFTCPEIPDGDTILAVYMIHQYGGIYIDGVLRTELTVPEIPGIGKTPGSNWMIVPMTSADTDKLVTVETKPVYPEVRRTPLAMRLTTESELFRDCFREDSLQMLISILILVSGLVFLGVFVYYSRNDADPQYLLLYISCIGIMTAIWRLTDLRFMDFLMAEHTKLLSYISFSSLMMSLVPMLVIASTQAGDRYQPFLKGSAIGLMGFDIVVLLLQVFNIFDLRQFAYGFNIGLFLIVLISTLLVAAREEESTGPVNITVIVVFLLCLAGITIDVTSYFVTQSSTGSVYTLIAFLLVVVGAGLHTMRGYLEQKKRLEAQEKELTENRISIMMSQIQPHFLYNSLASIYYLCDDDPQLAKKAIDEFSSYLRVNMDSLKQTRNVPFKEELKHIRNYLDLEKMRYEDRLTIFYDIEVSDFLVPALSVQPIVENAVRHGISKQPEGGTVSISTYEKDGWYEITVEDDGVGFDPEKGSDDKTRSHIGIENVRYRLREMCGGTLEITSEFGFGTTATIRIPAEKKNEETGEN